LPYVSNKLYHIHKIRETDWSIKYGQSRDTDNVGHKTQNKYKEKKTNTGKKNTELIHITHKKKQM
jgi:hypothetical protein